MDLEQEWVSFNLNGARDLLLVFAGNGECGGVNFMVKLLRAHGGCLGRSRR